MSRNKLAVFAVISLSFNIAVLAVFAFLFFSHYVDSGEEPEVSGNTACDPHRCSLFAKRFGLHPETAERFAAEMSNYSEEEAELRTKIMESRNQLMELLRGPEQDENEVMKKIDEISDLQGGLEKILVKRLLRVNSILSKPERDRLHRHLMSRMDRGMRGNGCPQTGPPNKRPGGKN